MLNKIVRIALTITGLILGLLVGTLINNFITFDVLWYNTAFIIGFGIVFGIIFFILTPKMKEIWMGIAGTIEKELLKFSTMDIISGAVGLIIGFIIAFLISQPFLSLNIPYIGTVLGTVISFLFYGFFGYLGINIATRKREDVILPVVNLKKAAGHKLKNDKNSHKASASPKILDTSVIIDGRIADIVKTGFLEGPIVIPEFVLKELRHIADSSDALKRNRGRRGLDILNLLQKEGNIEVIIESKDYADNIEVDIKLLKLAEELGGKVLTNDFNLNKVAELQGVQVLNINELANAVKPIVLPGEEMTVLVVKDGKESNQGLAYLDDGTMIVVEGGKKYIGDLVAVTVTSVLQTAAGRMIFAKLKCVVNKAI